MTARSRLNPLPRVLRNLADSHNFLRVSIVTFGDHPATIRDHQWAEIKPRVLSSLISRTECGRRSSGSCPRCIDPFWGSVLPDSGPLARVHRLRREQRHTSPSTDSNACERAVDPTG